MGQNKISEVSEETSSTDVEVTTNTSDKKSKSEKSTPQKIKVRSKTYQAKSMLVEKKEYSVDEAIDLLQKISYSTFDPSVEAHFNLSIDPKKSDQIIRRNVTLPHGIKKSLKIIVFGNDKQLKEAKEVGATYLGNEEMIAKVKSGWVDFDKVITTPEMMPKIAILAKVLGPKRLMPNTKNNTITTDIKSTLSDILSGTTMEIRNEKDFPIVHTKIGKLSFTKEQLKENFTATYNGLLKAKPIKAKVPYIKSISIKTTMSPSIKLDISSIE